MPSSLSTASAQSASSSTGRHSGAGTPRANEIIFCGGFGSSALPASAGASLGRLLGLGNGRLFHAPESSGRAPRASGSARVRRRILGACVASCASSSGRSARCSCAAGDTRIPRPLRVLAGFGLLPIPGPVDEAVLLLVAVPLALLYRKPLAEAWVRAAERANDRSVEVTRLSQSCDRHVTVSSVASV